ncbi:MFS transporter [Streptomyces cinnamoneus]|uniref:MFS transporter n=1 Tax=Streptomyces cinnamoneus TaxID=53446 RepID=UPI00343201CB
MADLRRLPGAYWRFLGGETCSALGSAFTAFALPLLVYRSTGSAVLLGGALAASYLPYLLFGLVIGAVADRVDRRWMLVGTNLASAAVLAALPALAAVGRLHTAELYLTSFLLTTLRIGFDAASIAAVPRLVDGTGLVRANGLLEAGNSAMAVLGPALAGVLVTVMPLQELVLLDAGSYLVSAAVILSLPQISGAVDDKASAERRAPGGVLSRLSGDVREGLRYVLADPVLRSLAAMLLLVNLVQATAVAQLVLLAKSAFGADDGQLGWLFGCGGAGAVAASLAAGRISDRLPFGALTLGSVAGVGVCTAALGLTGHYPLAVGAWAVASGLGVLFNIATMSLRQATVPEELLGRVLTASGVLAKCAVPLGALGGGAVVAQVGRPGPVYVVIGSLLVLLGLVFVRSPLGRARRPAAVPSGAVR